MFKMLFDYVVKGDRPSLIKSSKERSPATREKVVKSDRPFHVIKSDRPFHAKKCDRQSALQKSDHFLPEQKLNFKCYSQIDSHWGYSVAIVFGST